MNVAGCEVVPAVPVIVNGYCPGATDGIVVIESIDLNLGVPEVGLSDAETPSGAPETVRVTLLDGPDNRATVTVEFVLPPGVMVRCAGETDMEKSKGCTAFTTRIAFA
jgi:hypothetical protein